MLKKTFLIVFIIFACLSTILQAFIIHVSAEGTKVTLESITGEEREKIIENSRVTLLNSEKDFEHFPIVCFDVRDDGLVAIGTRKRQTNDGIIYVYKDGVFQYGYSFMADSPFAIKWDNNLIYVRFDRGTLILSIDRNGQVVQVLDDAKAKVDFYQWKKVVNDETYFMRNDFENGFFNVVGFIGSSYAQFCVTNAAGETTVLYDVSAKMLSRMTIAVIAFGSFFVIAILSLIIQGFRKRKKEKRFSY